MRSSGWRGVALLAILLSLGCSESPSQPDPLRAYAVPLRSDAELRAALVALCETATAEGNRPMLVEFSAAWCSDCMRLHEMKQAEPLADELARWLYLNVNVGRFDRHRALLSAMEITSIAHWSILQPTDCSAPLEGWPERTRRTLEVSSGEARHLMPKDLAAWLAQHRGA